SPLNSRSSYSPSNPQSRVGSGCRERKRKRRYRAAAIDHGRGTTRHRRDAGTLNPKVGRGKVPVTPPAPPFFYQAPPGANQIQAKLRLARKASSIQLKLESPVGE